ncbi:hypothetical protein FRC04_009210 [Tulasnella sp. 424]|nr:hypothetical protein FRC04_009210 [Tulasnella sp. 424]KAG8973564.1 hypothetical protein FRC05_008632 [Tulasnella sp. 425]
MADLTLTLNPTTTPFPWAALITAYYVSANVKFDVEATTPTLQTKASTVTDLDAILNELSPLVAQGDSTKQANFTSLAKTLPTVTAYPEVVGALDNLDDHLAYRTFLVGHSITVADIWVWGSLKGNIQALGVLKRNQHLHLSRWYSYIEGLPSTQAATTALNDAKATKAKTSKAASSFALGLPGAIEGQVVTRFPPEPSGYLHIGHTKAAILNQYFAAMYKGKLIVRFDDTNPAKEKEEFETTILEDLQLLDIKADRLTHTSDYFQELHDYCVQLLKSGKGYADDTDQMQMRQERMDGIASKRRDSSVEDNLKIFEQMTSGDPAAQGWCIRAKISVDDPNKALRDPVVYRMNVLPHHRTGDKWKVYPTYDFACPIVDSMEGVTHALRTNEYRDRNPQYEWMQEALGLRKTTVWDFSRVNFVYTLLSKRKLLWFVQQSLVQGWDDPRFPTVRGIRRRGLTVEALKQYMLSQGPSQATIMLEWDGIWALNKKIIDPIAPRYWAVEKKDLVKVTVEGQSGVETKVQPLHKKNPDVGEKTTVYGPEIYLDQEDAASFEDNEEITLMDWGNAIVKSKTKSASGTIDSIVITLHLEGDFKKTKKKITWLAASSDAHPLVPVTLIDYDYLISKKKLEEDDDVKDFVTPQTEFRTPSFSDANILKVKKGDIIQFERKGYYICDQAAEEGKEAEFVKIPDGKAASLASKATGAGGAVPPEKVDVVPKTKGGAGKGGWGKSGAQSAAKSPANVLTPTKESDSKLETKADSNNGAVKEGDRVFLSDGTSGFPIPISTKMYDVKPVVGDAQTAPSGESAMYQVKSVYDV